MKIKDYYRLFKYNLKLLIFRNTYFAGKPVEAFNYWECNACSAKFANPEWSRNENKGKPIEEVKYDCPECKSEDVYCI